MKGQWSRRPNFVRYQPWDRARAGAYRTARVLNKPFWTNETYRRTVQPGTQRLGRAYGSYSWRGASVADRLKRLLSEVREFLAKYPAGSGVYRGGF